MPPYNFPTLALTTLYLSQGYRFPVFLGKFFDFQPEEDHTSVGQLAIQYLFSLYFFPFFFLNEQRYMLLQTRGNNILLFPAWPQGWNVHFKLYTALQTTVEAACENGVITILNVIPASRRANVQIIGNACKLP